jgi:hypothetical protein
MTGVGSVGRSEGMDASAREAIAAGWAEGASMKWSVGRSVGSAVGRMTSPASAEQAKARAQTEKVRLMASG